MFSLISNVFVLNYHHRDLRIEKDMPKWVSKFIKEKNLVKIKFEFYSKLETLFCVKLAKLLRMRKFSLNQPQTAHLDENVFFEKHSTNDMGVFDKVKATVNKIKPMENEAQTIETPHLKEKSDEKKREINELKCKFVAIVMDRFFFYVALIYAIITFVALIMSIPNFYN